MFEIIMFIVCVWFFFAVIIPAIGSFFCMLGECFTPTKPITQKKKSIEYDYAKWDYDLEHITDREYDYRD